MRRRHAEEAGKAQRRDAGIDRFQRAPEHFRAHVDAERRLQGRPRGRRLEDTRCQSVGERPLGGQLCGLLQDHVNDLRPRRRDWCRVRAGAHPPTMSVSCRHTD